MEKNISMLTPHKCFLNPMLEDLPDRYEYYTRHMPDRKKLNTVIGIAGCFPVEINRIPWHLIQHLVITNYSSKFSNQPNGTQITEAFFNPHAKWLLLSEPSLEDILIFLTRCASTLKTINLRYLDIYSLPSLSQLSNLRSLELLDCTEITELKGLRNLTKLSKLTLTACRQLVELRGLENLTQLNEVCLIGCRQLEALHGLENLTQLTTLNLSGCSSFSTLPGLENLKHLTTLNLSGCSSFVTLPGLENLKQLTTLNLSSCKKLTELPDGIRQLKSLRRLDLRHMQLQSLPDWLLDIAEKFSLDYSTDYGNGKAIVSLADTTVEGVDMSIFARPHPVVVKWFEERKKAEPAP